MIYRRERAVSGRPGASPPAGRAAGVRARLPADTRRTRIGLRAARLLAALAVALAASGCANLGYYVQTVSGQFDIWRRERPIETVLADPAVPAALKDKLVKVRAIREYAAHELGLPDNDSYQRYADLHRRYVVWNVFAANEFSVEPVKWCFPIAGCVSYRGYFSRAGADGEADKLAAQGLEVFVGGVPAYSTLGWFADPVLSTFIGYPEGELARLLFHELAHQVLYVRDDTAFNESFAVSVEREGMRRWLAARGSPEVRARYERGRARQEKFVQMLIGYRAQLKSLYASGLAAPEMRSRKAALLHRLEQDYRRLRAEWGNHPIYDDWFRKTPNNAMLAPVALYTEYVPAFEALLEREGRDLPKFYKAVKALAALPQAERIARLNALADAKR